MKTTTKQGGRIDGTETMPARTEPHWMTDLCQRLSRVLDCELSFEDRESAESRPSVVPASHVVWQAAVPQQGEPAGHLRLRTLTDTQSDAPRSHSERAVEAAEIVAELFERLVVMERRSDRQDGHLETALEVPADSTSPPEIASQLLSAALRTVRGWAAGFFLLDETGQQLRLRESATLDANGIPQLVRNLADSPDARALQAGAALVTAGDADAELWLPESCQSAIVVPLTTTAGPLGTIWCYERRQRDWLPSEIQRLQTVGQQYGLAMERAVLLGESDDRRRMSLELSWTSRRHPGTAVGPLTVESGLDVALRSESPAELSGDLCEVWPIGPAQTLFVIGDATGHSVPAAMIMAVARGALRTLLYVDQPELRSPSALACCLNRSLHSVTQGEQFMTLVCGVYDRRTRQLQYANAGHPQPWLIRQGVATPLTTHGMLLGILPDSRYPQATVALQPGDLLVCYTDGVSESLSPQHELFRHTGILSALGGRDWPSAAAAADAIWSAAREHRHGHAATDDQTILITRVL